MLSENIIAGAVLVARCLPVRLTANTLQRPDERAVTVGSGCTVIDRATHGSTHAFGNLTSTVTPGGGSAFDVKCSQGTAYSVALDPGQNACGNQRRVQYAGEFVNCDLYQDTRCSRA